MSSSLRAPSRALLTATLLLSAFVALCYATVTTFEIVFTGSIRGAVMPRANGMSCTSAEALQENSYCVGGCAQRQAFIENVRAEAAKKYSKNDHVVVVDIGSTWWGSLFEPLTMANCINAAKYDILSLGYADFFAGTQSLSRFINAVSTDIEIIASNIDQTRDVHMKVPRIAGSPGAPYADGLTIPWVVRSVGGVPIVFIGLVPTAAFAFPTSQDVAPTEETGDSFSFRVQYNIWRAREANPDAKMVVILSDIPPADAEKLAREVQGISILFHGDGSEFGVRSMKSSYGSTVYLANIASNGETMGQMVVQWDSVTSAATVRTVGTDAIHDMSHQPIDEMSGSVQTTYNMIISASQSIEATFGEVVGLALENMPATRGTFPDANYPSLNTIGCRNYDCSLGRAVVEAYRRACLPLHNKLCDIAYINSGSLRAPLPQGDIKRSDVMNALAFRNPVYVLTMTGEQIMGALQHSIASAGTGGYAQTNLYVAWNPNTNRDLQQRLVEVRIEGPDGKTLPFDREAIYTVATSKFLYDGGDGYSAFAAALSMLSSGVDTDLLVDHLKENNPLDIPSTQDFAACLSNEVPIETMPAQNCRVVSTPLTAADVMLCATDLPLCLNPLPRIANEFYLQPNLTACNSCSGFGSCGLRQCTCVRPTTGRFKDMEVFRGSSCSEVLEIWSLNIAAEVIIFLVIALSLIGSVAMGVMIFLYREERAIRATSPLFGYLACLGGVLGSLAGILTAVPVDQVDCMAPMWLGVIGYVLLFGSLFVRTHRIHAIFNSKTLASLSKKVNTDFALLQRLGILLLIDLVLLIVFQIMDPQTVRPTMLDDGFQAELSCKSDNLTFVMILIVYNAILLLWGVYLAVRTRNVDKNFNESSRIGFSIYNCAFTALVALILIFALDKSFPNATKVVQTVAIAYVVLFTLGVVYIPCFLKLKAAADLPATEVSGSTLQMASLGGNFTHSDAAIYMAHIGKLEQALADNGHPIPERPPLHLPASSSGYGDGLARTYTGAGEITSGGGIMAPSTASAAEPAAGVAGNGEEQPGLQKSNSGMFGRSNRALGRAGSVSGGAPAGGQWGAVPLNTGAAPGADGGATVAGAPVLTAGADENAHDNRHSGSASHGGQGDGEEEVGSIYKPRPKSYDAMLEQHAAQKHLEAERKAELERQKVLDEQRRAAMQAAQDRNSGVYNARRAAAAGGAAAGGPGTPRGSGSKPGTPRGSVMGLGARTPVGGANDTDLVNPYAQGGASRGQRRLFAPPPGDPLPPPPPAQNAPGATQTPGTFSRTGSRRYY